MINDIEITPEIIEKHGITPEEYEDIQEILGRDPNFTELGIFSVMWSEHCSYKNSRPQLKKFPTTGPRVLVKAGEENAGVIDIGGGMAICFKIESHNHPSAVEPFQGAATGVGGILRDIFTMGARPVALMNSLRFGPIHGESEQHSTNRRLLGGVVEGISHYGNCMGIPTVGGEVHFDPSYNGNPLVNVFCLGTLRHDQIQRGAASGVGNPVFYVGAKTGRDGLAGAAFASRDLTEESKEDRPAVQVGDPFMEKLLMEACLELYEHSEAVVGVQDMGAAGLTCSTCETASRGNAGIDFDLVKVPQRETGMTPYETMLSESQERMLIIGKKGHEDTIRKVFEKWDLDAAEVGEVTEGADMVVRDSGEIVAQIPARKLADEAPVYHREAKEPADLKELQTLDFDAEVAEPSLSDLLETLPRMMALPSIASKRWIYLQYDHMVQTGSVVLPGGDASVIRIEMPNETGETECGGKYKYIAMTVDCNGRFCALDPYEGAKGAMAEAARNITMTGAEPLAITDNLNFGNPHIPEVFWQLKSCVDGLTEGCHVFDTPVTGGNVSLYNQSPLGAIDPTPVVGMVGLIDKAEHITTVDFKEEGDIILLIGSLGSEMGGSAYLSSLHEIRRGTPPKADLHAEKAMLDAVRNLIRSGLVKSAHDLAEGGLAVALTESCLAGGKGAHVKLPVIEQRLDVSLFNESNGRAVISVAPEQLQDVITHLEALTVEFHRIGKVTQEESLHITQDADELIWQLSDLEAAYEGSLPSALG